MYSLGRCVAQSNAEALRWFRRGANHGCAQAHFMLGHFYENGRGVAHDVGEAAEWYKKAADLGFVESRWNLGRVLAGRLVG
jgi:TPR repeat protein